MHSIALQKNLFKKARIMLNTSQIMLDFAKLCLALMLNAKRLKIMPKSIIMLNMATLLWTLSVIEKHMSLRVGLVLVW